MEIGETIRKYRKMMNLTQEEIANYLNISAPAVNKWENGISYPDISLLAPLARILKIDVNELLSFNVQLTQKEIKNFLEDISKIMLEEGFEQGFKRGEELIKEYPNCDNLAIRIAESMNIYLESYRIKDSYKYDKKIISWYEVLASSSNERTVSIANYDLAVKYIKAKDYEKAQKFLDKILIDDPLGLIASKKIMQAQIFKSTGKNEAAYGIYEEILLRAAGEIITSLSFIIKQLCDEKKYDLAKEYHEVFKKTSELYDLDVYSRIMSDLIISTAKQDKTEFAKNLKKVISEFENISDNSKSNLYKFRKFIKNFKRNSLDSDKCKSLLKSTINKNKDFDFIRDDSRVKDLLNY